VPDREPPAPRQTAAAGLFESNTAADFWRVLAEPQPAAEEWAAAVRAAAEELPAAARRDGDDLASLLHNTLGEGQFGPGHWRLSLPRRAYYWLKPLLPRALTTRVRGLHRGFAERAFPLGWPQEPRFARFQYAVARNLAEGRGWSRLPFTSFWPEGRRYALVLTHDIESSAGQSFAARVADQEEVLGFRSAFNFVARDYRHDPGLIADLRSRGFEVGVHGCHHDGRDFAGRARFRRRAAAVNERLRALGATGYRSPLTIRNPVWMQELEIEYDCSFFDTDPYEPLPGGVMTLWPFRIGRFVELPYTLAQDHTLARVLGQRTPAIWLDKVGMIRRFGGLALLNCHPDYLREQGLWDLYRAFLETLRPAAGEYWQALPVEVARWWRSRAEAASPLELPGARSAYLDLDPEGGIRLAA